MSINAISISCMAMCVQPSNLSDATRKKLRELGIDPSTVKTEEEAKKLIEETIASKIKKSALSKSPKAAAKSESKIISQIKILASQVGVSVSMTDSADEILEKTAKVIEKLPDSDLRKKIFKEQMGSLKFENDEAKAKNGMIDNLMSYDAINNKLALGL
ncbi:hypothetical protein J6E39_02765 [bacterium]|nr:hypothetical protein [bacterium]